VLKKESVTLVYMPEETVDVGERWEKSSAVNSLKNMADIGCNRAKNCLSQAGFLRLTDSLIWPISCAQ